MKTMTISQLQGQLQQILLDDHPLSAEQRFAIKSAIEVFGMVQNMAPGFREAVKQMQEKMSSRGAVKAP